MKAKVSNPFCFSFLNDKTPLQAKMSDHNLLIHNNILFFNMMMQCNWNEEKKRYNNGFALIENNTQYQERIRNIVRTLAEAIFLNPQITIVGLVEAPIKYLDINCFIEECSKYPSLSRFIKNLNHDMFTSMGVATLIDETYDVTPLQNDAARGPSSVLQNRIQEFVIKSTRDDTQFHLFNLHFPFDFAKSIDNTTLVRFAKKLFFKNKSLPVLVMGDFNFDPEVIAKQLPDLSYYIQTPNNLLIKTDRQGTIVDYELDTVDGILQNTDPKNASTLAYQNTSSWHGLNPKRELSLFKQFIESKLSLFSKSKNQQEVIIEQPLLTYN